MLLEWFAVGTKLIRLSVKLVSAQLTQSQHDFAVIHIRASKAPRLYSNFKSPNQNVHSTFRLRRCAVGTPVFLLNALVGATVDFHFVGSCILTRALQTFCWFSTHSIVIQNSWVARKLHLNARAVTNDTRNESQFISCNTRCAAHDCLAESNHNGNDRRWW